MSTWRYVQNGRACGPVDTASLQALLNSGTLSGDTMVWKEGMPDWVPARSVPDFTIPPSAPGQTPRATTETGAPPPVQPPPVPGSAGSDAADIERNKIYAILAYLPLLFLVPLLAAPESRFARYHANQGTVLFLAVFLLGAASLVLSMVPFVACFLWFLPVLVGIGWLVLMILGIVNAASGQYKPLPLIGHFELLK